MRERAWEGGQWLVRGNAGVAPMGRCLAPAQTRAFTETGAIQVGIESGGGTAERWNICGIRGKTWLT